MIQMSELNKMRKYIHVGMKKYNTKTVLPKKLESYDDGIYTLEQGDRVPSGFWAFYFCCHHNDITAQGDTKEECNTNLAIKANLMIESGLIKECT